MTTRRFTKSVTAEVDARRHNHVEEFGRLRPGDEFRVSGRKGAWRFMHVTPDGGVQCFGPVRSGREMVRTFRPEIVHMPSQRALNAQRRRKETP